MRSAFPLKKYLLIFVSSFACSCLFSAGISTLVGGGIFSFIFSLWCVNNDWLSFSNIKDKGIKKKIILLISLILSTIIPLLQINDFIDVWSCSSKLQSVSANLGVSLTVLLFVIALFGAVMSINSICILINFLLSFIVDHFVDYIISLKNCFIHLFNFKKKIIIKSFLIILLSAIVGLILLFASFLIPFSKIQGNVRDSIDTIKSEGLYKQLSLFCTSQLDGFSDSIMLIEASFDSGNSVINNAIMDYDARVGDNYSTDSLILHFENGVEYDTVTSYSRYWHGYLVFLKPLLYFFNYTEIRIINMFCHLLLVTFVCFVFYKKKLKEIIIPYLIVYLMLMPIAIGLSLQFSDCFYIFNIGVLGVLYIDSREKRQFLFLILGIMTSFFDLLSYPLITLGIPLVVSFYRDYKNQVYKKATDNLKWLFVLVVMWGIGYVGMWASKWILGSLITGNNLFTEAFHRIQMRSSGEVDSQSISRVTTIFKNGFTYLYTPFSLAFLLFSYYYIFKKKVKLRPESYISQIMICIAVLPIVWYFLIANHSSIHFWFTNKASAIITFSLMVLLLSNPEHLNVNNTVDLQCEPQLDVIRHNK